MQLHDSNLSLRQSILNIHVMCFVHGHSYCCCPSKKKKKKTHIKYTGRDITALHKMLKTLSVPVKWLLPVISSPGLSFFSPDESVGLSRPQPHLSSSILTYISTHRSGNPPHSASGSNICISNSSE